jgi:hypothetical protein
MIHESSMPGKAAHFKQGQRPGDFKTFEQLLR